MKIPVKKGTDRRTVSVTQLRSYGAAGFDLGHHEESRGCPRQYHHRYVLRDVAKSNDAVLVYGRIIHEALELMENEAISPEDALARVWDPALGPDWYSEALDDLRSYLERPADAAAAAVIGTEVELTAVLFEDDEGPVYFTGRLDQVELDYSDPFLIRVRDWKTNRLPPSVQEVRADAQGKGYSWLVLQNLERFGFEPGDPRVRVVFHLDAIKWRELPSVFFDERDLEAWHAWMVALVRHIQDDEDPQPRLNPGCATCPVRDSCPAYKGLVDVGGDLLVALAAVKPDDRDALVAWREQANRMRLLLEKGVKEVDGRFMADAHAEGDFLAAGGFVWERKIEYRNTTDVRRLHQELGDDGFYRVVSVTKAALDRETQGLDGAVRARALDCIRSEVVGSKIVRRKDA